MSPETLNEREFELINIVGGQLAANQRDLSRRLKLSLGLTNMVMRRLVTKGYIRIKQLNQRKVEYILTPKGFAEKMRKSVTYTLKTIHSISLIKNCLQNIIDSLHQAGIKKFYILGQSDLALLIEGVLKEKHPQDYSLILITDRSQAVGGIILVCTEEVEGTAEHRAVPINQKDFGTLREINVLEALANQAPDLELNWRL